MFFKIYSWQVYIKGKTSKLANLYSVWNDHSFQANLTLDQNLDAWHSISGSNTYQQTRLFPSWPCVPALVQFSETVQSLSTLLLYYSSLVAECSLAENREDNIKPQQANLRNLITLFQDTSMTNFFQHLLSNLNILNKNKISIDNWMTFKWRNLNSHNLYTLIYDTDGLKEYMY